MLVNFETRQVVLGVAVVCLFCIRGEAGELDDVKRDLASGKAVLIDVREMDEWQEGHLKDARCLPLSRIEKGIRPESVTALAPEGTIVYLHCAAGARSQTAAKLLKYTGRDVRPLRQGYDELLEAGFPRAVRH